MSSNDLQFLELLTYPIYKRILNGRKSKYTAERKRRDLV